MDIEFSEEVKLRDVPVLVALSGEEKEPILGCEKIFESLRIVFEGGRKIKIEKL